MKVTVYFSFILELLQTAMVTHDTWAIFVTGFGDMAELNDLHFLWFTLPILGGIGKHDDLSATANGFNLRHLAGLLCHLTFAFRVSLLAESKIAGAIILVVSNTSYVFIRRQSSLHISRALACSCSMYYCMCVRSQAIPSNLLFRSNSDETHLSHLRCKSQEPFRRRITFRVKPSLQIWNGAGAFCDVLIAVGMTYYVSAKKTIHERARMMLDGIPVVAK